MATKGVLGNDPFQRGAAQRSDEPQSSEAPEPAQASKKAKAPAGKTAKKAAPTGGKKAAAKKAAPEKKAAPAKGRKAGGGKEETNRLREPAAPQTPRRRPPSRVPVVAESPKDTLPRTPEEQEVDQVLASATAMEAAEAAAEAAAEVAVETMRSIQTQQGASVAPRGSLEDTWNRELATAVVAEAAEAAAEAIIEAALAPQEERTQLSSAFEEELPSSNSAERTVIDTAYALSEEEDSEGVDTAGVQAEAEVELPDGGEDEYPPERAVPLSLVPPPEDRETAREPFFTDQAGAESEPSMPRSVGVFSMAKEIAIQALASASVGRAMGAAQGLVGAVRAGLGTAGSTSLDEYGRDSELVTGLQPLMDFLYERYWRVSVQGVEQVPSGGAILVANHSGALPFDGLVAAMTLLRERPDLREPRWLVEDQVFHAPMLGTLFNRLGAVRACPENAVRLLDEQRPVLVFPEGYQGLSKPFAQRYQLKRFGRGGFVKLALRTGAPIIPVAIVGAEETSPLLGRIPAGFLGVPYLPLTGPVPLPAKWTLRFGEPISVDALGPEDADDLAAVQRLTERTRESIQGMIQALLRERRSVFAG
ncbi:lysophospholipid acyltransferase family protein [Hyalangium rubrum]|uniref:Lysophospholipid acyltransferase family protein n=1 Tax=Hyalangium rubrum TaxID=3103134 RepID=A0ABU5H3Q7_9BACT|nr:lysophospholipid acyltransferase family protein [Hyalangium sp. s54d21]MDY7227911.1 lysophospholipid acyltransferase family protein [Hyalangium sp. s54d21]